MSLKKNIDKIILRENEIEQLLVNSSNLKQSELVELSKELSDIKPVTDLAKKKDVMLLMKFQYLDKANKLHQFLLRKVKIF